MTTAEMRCYLRRYRTNIKEIRARLEHLNWLEKEVYFPLQEAQEVQGKVLDKARATMLKIVTDIHNEVANLEREANEIEKLIGLLKGDERLVVYARYIIGARWLEIPPLLNYELAQCQRIERRAVLNLIKIKNRQSRK